jgi:hypothetical protein
MLGRKLAIQRVAADRTSADDQLDGLAGEGSAAAASPGTDASAAIVAAITAGNPDSALRLISMIPPPG